jgi:hypothetical protein
MNTLSRQPVRAAPFAALAICTIVTLVLPAGAQAQWAWRDAAGNITYSDSPPPADVRPDAILHQPSPVEPARNDAGNGRSDGSAPAARETPRPPSPAKSLAEQEADFRKRQAAREKAEQKQAEDEAKAAQRAADCNQARGYLEMVEGGTRLLRPDASGNRNFMDDEQRAAEIAKTREQIAKNCEGGG